MTKQGNLYIKTKWQKSTLEKTIAVTTNILKLLPFGLVAWQKAPAESSYTKNYNTTSVLVVCM